RPAEPTGLAGWVAMLDAGVPRAVVVQGIENSAEHLGLVVDGLYSKILGRAADAAGRQAFVQYLQAGHTMEEVAWVMAASPEFANANRTDTAWVQTVYSKLLGRAAAAGEVSMWVSALPTMTRAGVANAILTSAESRAGAVQQMYGFAPAASSAPASLLARELNRPVAPAAGEVNGWVSSVFDVRTMEALVAGSDEFFANV